MNFILKTFKFTKNIRVKLRLNTSIHPIYSREIRLFSSINNNNNNNKSENKLNNQLNNEQTEEKDEKDEKEEENNMNLKDFLENNEEEVDKLKSLSFKLISFSNANEVIELFESEFMNKQDVSLEEYILLLYFYVKLSEKDNILDSKKNHSLLISLLNQTSSLLNENKKENQFISFSSILALTTSISSLYIKFDIKTPINLIEGVCLNIENFLKIESLIQGINELPLISFSLSNIIDSTDNSNSKIKNQIENIIVLSLNKYFIIQEQMKYKDMNMLNYSTSLLSLHKINEDKILENLNILNNICKNLDDNKEDLSEIENNIEDFLKIAFVLSNLNIEDKLKDIKYEKYHQDLNVIHSNSISFLNYYLEKNIILFNYRNLLEIFDYFMKISPNHEIITLISEFALKLKDSAINDKDIFIDITLFINVLLSCSKHYIQKNYPFKNELKEISNSLISIYDGLNEKKKHIAKLEAINFNQMYNNELCSIIICTSIMKFNSKYFILELLKEITNRINKNKFEKIEYIQLLASAKYIFDNIDIDYKDYYYLVHNKLVSSREFFNEEQRKLIKSLLIKDKIITESPYL